MEKSSRFCRGKRSFRKAKPAAFCTGNRNPCYNGKRNCVTGKDMVDMPGAGHYYNNEENGLLLNRKREYMQTYELIAPCHFGLEAVLMMSVVWKMDVYIL